MPYRCLLREQHALNPLPLQQKHEPQLLEVVAEGSCPPLAWISNQAILQFFLDEPKRETLQPFFFYFLKEQVRFPVRSGERQQRLPCC